MHRWLSLNHSISHRELGTEPPRHGHGKFHWLDQATVQFGGTFLKSEVYEARALGKAFLFALTLIPYWMVYSQVFDSQPGFFFREGVQPGLFFRGLDAALQKLETVQWIFWTKYRAKEPKSFEEGVCTPPLNLPLNIFENGSIDI